MRPWFDTHIHLLAPEWRQTPQELYRQALASGIGGMLMPGVRSGDWPRLLELARQLPGVYLAPGLHPAYAGQWSPEAAQQLRALTREPQVVAIGEIGLDGVAGPPLEAQEAVFREQLQIALDAELPVLLHCRKATGRVLEVLRELQIGRRVGGVWHGFSGSVQTALELSALGVKIGVGPVLLRGSARKLPQAVLALPDEALLLETDAPDMVGSPLGLLDVAARLAGLKGWSLEQTMQVTAGNARTLLGI
ncbi:MAG: TatD family hydrolase [Desulfuromonadales bacterium]|nr:TatD family hydrolase [Desulfuromonadales bacterium]